MKTLDRSKFRPAEISTLENEQKKLEKFSTKTEKNYTGFAKVVDGVNEFRILPSIDGTSPYIAFTSAMLEIEQPDYQNGEKVGTVLKKKRILNASVHGKSVDGQEISDDPIAMYVRYVEKMASNHPSKEKFLAPIKGYMSSKGWVSGIKPQMSYVCYVHQDDEIRRLELKTTWFKEIQKISAKESSDTELTLDIFSDPDQGFPLVITKDKDNNNKVTYSVEAKSLKRNQSWDQYFAENMVSDEVLIALSELPTLKSLFVDVYTKKDFDNALEGLKRFDDAHPEYNIFSNTSFLTELDVLAREIPEDKKATEVENVEVEEDKPATVAPKETKVTPIAMRKALKEYISENYPDKTLPTLSGDELIEWYNISLRFEELPFVDEVEDVDCDDATETEDNTSVPENDTPTDALARVRALREKRAQAINK